jgi:hypothetical protein
VNQNSHNQNHPNANTVALYLVAIRALHLVTVRTLLAASAHHSLQLDTAVTAAPFSPGHNNWFAQEDALALAAACYSSSSSCRE